ncbi:MAG: Gfo/Idh/MocA family oxidoreductase [Planctomycetota bacterium]
MSDLFSRRAFLSRSGQATAVAAGAMTSPGRAAGQAAGKKKIRIAQLGVGHAHAAGKMQAYRQSGAFEVVGVCEPDESLRRKASAAGVYKDLRWVTREELLNLPGLEAVAVETRVRDSLDHAEACVEAALHIHLDKPAGSSLPKFRKILRAAAARKRVVQMGYMYRYNPGIVFLREALQKGWLGEVFEVHTVMSKVVGAGSRKTLAEYPGGVMFELGCHIIDLVVGVLGAPRKVSAFPRHSSELADGLVDNMLAVLEYPRALATVKSSAQEVEGFARRHLVVCGSEGTLQVQPLDSPAVRLALSKPREKFSRGYQDVRFPRYSRYVDDAADFARIIRGEKESDFSIEHDEAVQRVVLEACGLPVDR